MTGKNRITMEIIAKALENQPDVESAYLFGSAVMGVERTGSDLDIAVHLDDELSAEGMGERRLELMALLEQGSGRDIDLVILNTASLKLIHQVLAYGKRIYVKDLDKESDFILRKRKQYFDFKYYIDQDIQEMRTFYGV